MNHFRLLLCIAVLGATPAMAAQNQKNVAAASPAVVDTSYVADALKRGAIVWDTRDADAYNKGHIPGAMNIGDVGKALRYDSTEDYIPLPQIEKILGDAGIDPSREIIVYGGKGDPFAYFGLLTVQYLGGSAAHIFHGGVDDWKAAGHALSTEATKLAPVALKLKVNPAVTVDTREVLRRAKSGAGDVQIVDVRTPKEYSGEDIRAIRGGHVPGAINIPFEQNWVDPATPQKLARKEVNNKDGMALKQADQLKALYGKLDPGKETIVYCQSGVRAAESATILKDLGFKKVKVYDSSWLGYGNQLDAPAQDMKYFNVGQVNARLAALQQRIDVLEKELAENRKK